VKGEIKLITLHFSFCWKWQ